MSILDDSLEPPTRKDFRRIGKYQVPQVVLHDKRVTYGRPSSAGKILDDESNLVDWQKRTIIFGAAQRPDLMATASTLDQDRNKHELRDIVEECLVSGKGQQRAVTGTAIHRMLDRVDDPNDDWTPAPQFQAAVDAYIRTLELYGLVPVDIEVHCINDAYRLAGSMDRRYRTTRNMITPTGEIIPIGTIIAADTKTGQSLEYASGSYATQLAAYATSMRYDVETDERSEFDPPTFQDWALIMHVDAADGRCDVYWCDLAAGREALALAQAVKAWRKRTDLIVPARAPLHAVPEVIEESDKSAINADAIVVSVADVIEELDASLRAAADRHPSAGPERPPQAPQAPLAAVEGTPAPTRPLGAGDVPTVDLAAVRAWLRERIANVRAAGDMPTAKLLRDWPQGVPGLKHDTQTAEMLDAISEVLWNVEKEYSLAFPSSDPRTPKVEPRNFSDRWAKPTGKDDPRAESGDADGLRFRMEMDKHPRRALLHGWAGYALANVDPKINDRWALTHALYEFAMLPLDEWSDGDVTEMLDGTLRAIGYDDGVMALGHVVAEHAPLIMSSAFAITAGNAILLYDENGKPVVRTIN